MTQALKASDGGGEGREEQSVAPASQPPLSHPFGAEPVPVSDKAGIANADYSGNDFIRGAQACREMMARFVDQGGAAIIAGSIRANWHPGWDEDPGPPPDVIDTWEAPECPEGEALYAEYCKSVAGDEDHKPDISPQGLSQTADMLERWAIPMLPANRHGQIPFLRGLIECAIRDLRGRAMADGGFIGPNLAERIASAIEAPSGGETAKAGSTEGESAAPEGGDAP